MKFAIITHVEHKFKDNKWIAYEPYVREMNLWLKFVDEVKIVAPISLILPFEIDTTYNHNSLTFEKIPSFNILSLKNSLRSVIVIPNIIFKIFKAMRWADHIHLRCPGNIGLIGCFVQILFPNKPKTVKYAGNWDPKSKQPLSYKLQKLILSNTFLTKNVKVLVYGEWKNQSKNIVPFFTATYSKNECISINQKDFLNEIKFLFVGALSKGKKPMLSVKTIHKLKSKGYNVKLQIYGEGEERSVIEKYIVDNDLQKEVFLFGNVDKEQIKKAYQQAHFLLFVSASEGWPKVIAEAMFWGCVPITSNVSCIPFMVGNGNRGTVVNPNIDDIISLIEKYLTTEELYKKHSENAVEWSQHYTIEKFEKEIEKLLIH